MNKLNSRKIQIQYTLLQGIYWMLFCVTIGYVNSYLIGLGMGPDKVGLITAIFGGTAALIQSYLGTLSDKSRKIDWKHILIGLAILRLIGAILLEFSRNPTFSGIVFGFNILLMYATMPFINGASFYYEQKSYKIKFGISRGTGSLLFAILSYIIGALLVAVGERIISILGIILSISFFVVIFTMPYFGKVKEETQISIRENSNFIKKYPVFVIVLIASTLLMIFHNTTSTYMLQTLESVGGTNKELGLAYFIGAMTELPIMFGFSLIKKKLSPYMMLLICSISFVIKGLLFLLASSLFSIYLAQLLQLSSFALFAGASVFYADQAMDLKDKLKGQTLMSATITLGGVFGNLIGGYMIKYYGAYGNLIFALISSSIAAIILLALKGKHKKLA